MQGIHRRVVQRLPIYPQSVRRFFILAFRRNNPLSQKPGATYGELIITNYDPRPYIQPQFSMFPAEIENGDLVLVHEPTCGSLREINLARREKELGH